MKYKKTMRKYDNICKFFQSNFGNRSTKRLEIIRKTFVKIAKQKISFKWKIERPRYRKPNNKTCHVRWDSESLKRKEIALAEVSIMETRMSCHIKIIRQKRPVNSDGYLSCKS